ncbi:uncharacterized protein [Chelonus insularis]|uniref:uncharacterized protein n=1 Tax=Chelonus insularis TaxID=460826 RepID=UPI00158D3F6F|nr:uncharacterized protein LOC118071395 [Chelonus insularis]
MTKCCVVQGCKSGHSDDERKRKAKGFRKRTLFQVPKCHIRRQLWVNALQQELKDSDRVCELHFLDEYIVKGKSVLINGESIFIENERWHLTDNAIPLREEKCQNQQSMNCNQSTEEEQSCSLSEQQIFDQQFIQEEQILLVDTENLQPTGLLLEQSVEPSVSQMECDEIIPNEVLLEQTASSLSAVSLALPNELSLEQVVSSFSAVLPERWCYYVQSSDMILIHLDVGSLLEKLRLRVTADLSVTLVMPHRSEIILTDRVSSMEELYASMRKAESLTICCGTLFDENRYATQCSGIITPNENYQRQQLNPRCRACRILRQRIQANMRYKRDSTLAFRIKRKKEIYRQRCHRLIKKQEILQQKLMTAKKRCSERSEKILKEQLTQLPESQQLAVWSCFEAAKHKKVKGRRYDLEWIYECLSIRMKGRNIYNFIRERNILPLPHIETLNRYIQKISSSAYGFQPALFDCMKQKAQGMTLSERRGTLIIDEIKLSEAINFDIQKMEFSGFVNLGQYTSEREKNVPGDHALVFMYVPFRGRWLQAVAAFISKNCATSAVLHTLIIECIILLESANFFVDVITSDGAQSNRGVWTKFDISESIISCQHPCDTNR